MPDWLQDLNGSHLGRRLYAARALARQKEAWTLLSHGRQLPLFVWVACLAETGASALLERGKPAIPARLALALLRRRPRPGLNGDRQRALEGFRAACHPQQLLGWTLRILESQAERAIPHFLDVLRAHGDPDPCECAAWALGQLGRIAIPEIVDLYRQASPAQRYWLGLALWHMGPQAAAAGPVLGECPGEMAEAVLLGLESAGSPWLLRRRRGTLWLDDWTVEQLAHLTFSLDEKDRLYAARALGGVGPAEPWSLLGYLSLDSSVLVAEAALETLGPERAVPWLLKALDRPQLHKLAWRKLEGYPLDKIVDPAWEQAAQAELGALGYFIDRGLPGGRGPEIANWLRTFPDPALIFLLRALPGSPYAELTPNIVELLARPEVEVQLEAAKALLLLEADVAELDFKAYPPEVRTTLVKAAIRRATPEEIRDWLRDPLYTEAVLEEGSDVVWALLTVEQIRDWLRDPRYTRAVLESPSFLRLAQGERGDLIWPLLTVSEPTVRREAHNAAAALLGEMSPNLTPLFKRVLDLGPQPDKIHQELTQEIVRGEGLNAEIIDQLGRQLKPGQVQELLQRAYPNLSSEVRRACHRHLGVDAIVALLHHLDHSVRLDALLGLSDLLEHGLVPAEDLRRRLEDLPAGDEEFEEQRRLLLRSM